VIGPRLPLGPGTQPSGLAVHEPKKKPEPAVRPGSGKAENQDYFSPGLASLLPRAHSGTGWFEPEQASAKPRTAGSARPATRQMVPKTTGWRLCPAVKPRQPPGS